MAAKQIFVSRPTTIGRKFENTHKAFEHFLTGHKIKPRRIGGSDFSDEVPLKAVLELYKECSGAIILGYPQTSTTISHASAKNPIYIASAPTPWNHIEAAIAYTKRLPVIAISHTGISGGVFDPKVVGKFVHQTDLSKKEWFKNDDFLGFFESWKAKLK